MLKEIQRDRWNIYRHINKDRQMDSVYIHETHTHTHTQRDR